MRVKICGVTNVTDARAAADAGADFVGLILAASPRQVSLETARAIAAALPPKARPVLLFRDAPTSEIVAAVERTGVEWVQLHGREPVADVQQLAVRLPDLRLIKAWEVRSAEPAELAAYLAQARAADLRLDALILDAPKGGPHPGVAALATLARAVRLRPPEVWCAGGLTPENVAAVCAAGPFDGVDVAGGVERAPGQKDAVRMARFVTAARAADGRRDAGV